MAGFKDDPIDVQSPIAVWEELQVDFCVWSKNVEGVLYDGLQGRGDPSVENFEVHFFMMCVGSGRGAACADIVVMFDFEIGKVAFAIGVLQKAQGFVLSYVLVEIAQGAGPPCEIGAVEVFEKGSGAGHALWSASSRAMRAFMVLK